MNVNKKFEFNITINVWYVIGITLGVLSVLMLTGCSKQPEAIDFKTLEDARAQARANAGFNAQLYRAENPRFDDSYKVIEHGDSTQSASCPQGDGWASISIMKVEGKEVDKFKIKCSTVSSAVGCLAEADFVKKPNYVKMDGNCQPTSEVPFPLPKIAK